jgi:hypothetical protein
MRSGRRRRRAEASINEEIIGEEDFSSATGCLSPLALPFGDCCKLLEYPREERESKSEKEINLKRFRMLVKKTRERNSIYSKGEL